MNLPNRILEYVFVAWPRVLAVKTLYPANMDVPHAMGRPILAAELRSPVRFPGPKRIRTDSVVTVQSRLRGLPYFEALTLDRIKRERINLTVQSPPRAPTGTDRGV